jgi:lipid-binding SYLF domain-containing protein
LPHRHLSVNGDNQGISSMLSRNNFVSLLAGTALALFLAPAHAAGREEARILTATQVLEELRGSRDQAIPDRLLERAYGIAVVPDVAKVAFWGGGRYGKGLLVVRDKNGNFTSPVFIRLAGGSFGPQIGVQSADIVLVFTTRAGIEGITDGKLTLGGDASVAAGPVGRQASAGTDANFAAEVYSYSRARGLFAGIALDGTALTIDRRANANFYKKNDASASDIINGTLKNNDAPTQRFLAVIATSTAPAAQTAVPGTSTPGSTNNAPAAVGTPATNPSGAAQTYPMEDPAPGHEPNK